MKKLIMLETTDKIELNSIVYDPTFGFGQIILKSNEECFYNTHESGGSITTPWKRNLGDRLKHYHFYLIDTDAEIKEGSYYFANQSIRKCIKVNKGLYPYIHLNKKREEIGDFHTWRGNVIALTGVAKNPDNIKVNLPLLSGQSIKLAIDCLNRTGKKEVEVKVGEITLGRIIDDSEWVFTRKTIKLNQDGKVDIVILEEKPKVNILHEVVKILERAGVRKYTCINNIGYSQVERDLANLIQSGSSEKLYRRDEVISLLYKYLEDEVKTSWISTKWIEENL